MTKDFAHRANGGRQTSGGSVPGWVWLLAGVALGFGGAVVYSITRPAGEARAIADTGADKATPDGKKRITIPPKEQSRFAFYELLPNYEVPIPKDLLRKPPADTGAAAGSGRYLIQVGSFKERTEAEQQKANLALLGIESRIEKVTIDNDQTWYRVRVGPEKDQRRVETILTRLEENDIKALVMMVPE